MSNLHLRCMEYAFEDRQDYGLGGAGKLDSFDTIFTSPIKWNLKDNQGNVMEGSTARASFKVFVYGDPSKKKTRKATFSMPDPKSPDGEFVFPWEYLEDSDVTFAPLFQMKSIYSGGGKASIQMEIISAVVTSFIRLNTKGEQKDVIEKYNKDEEVVARVAEQLRQMQELMGVAPPKTNNDTKKKDDSPIKTKAGTKQNKLKNIDDDDEDDDKTSKGKKLLLPKKKNDDSDDSEDDSNKKKKNNVVKKKIIEEDEDDSDNEKKTSKGKKKDDSDDEKKTPKGKKKDDSDDEGESGEPKILKSKKKNIVEKETEEEDEQLE